MIAPILIITYAASVTVALAYGAGYRLGYHNGRSDTAQRWAEMMPEIKERVRTQERNTFDKILAEELKRMEKETRTP